MPRGRRPHHPAGAERDAHAGLAPALPRRRRPRTARSSNSPATASGSFRRWPSRRAVDRIIGAQSFRILDAVVAVLSAHPEARRVEVQGHTDNVGDPAANRALSQRRADMVRTYLTAHGIAEDRVIARG